MSISYGKTKAACYTGLVVQAIINNFLPILFIIFREDYGLGYEELGRITLINFLTQIVSDMLAPKISDKIGYRGAGIACQGLAAVGLVLLSILPNITDHTYTAILLSVVVYAFASGLMEVLLSPMVELLPTKNKGANMAFLHSFYCWGQAFTVIGTTLLVKLLGFGKWSFIPLIWAVVPFVNMFSFMFVPIVEPKKTEETGGFKDFVKTRAFLCFIIFMLCAGASELTMAGWASMFAQQGLGLSKMAGDLLGPCAFALFMGTGRVIFGVFSGRFSVRKVFIINNILCCLCYLAVGLGNMPAFSVVACALCGFSVSLSWPGTVSMAAARFKNGGTVMFSVLALCGDLGCSIGPWLLGVVADSFGLQNGFLVSTIFPLIMVLTAIFLLKEKDCKIR